ncbi:uncharacterized protein NPIL_297571 [Nephila pilipes]|uniref:Uncharacterized protein n=1 Tax=Nephila pilipes TaxID=299642 RepID=A0A8X6PLP3_NEPPI|nr:uncharacterized protein NPIL_297571 [Nephila pilipes]
MQSASKTPAEGAEGKDSDIVQSYEQLPIPDSSLLEVSSGYNSESGVSENDEDQSREMSSAKNEEVECWYKFLRRKIGLDINARQLIETNPELAKINKSELMIRLAYELCLAKNTEYNPENDAAKNEEENNKHRKFDTSRVFALFKVLNEVIEKSDRKNFVEFVCQKGNVKLLKMIYRQENRDGGGLAQLNQQYSWKGEFTGYERLIDLLQYVIIERPCSPEIVLCIAEKVYGGAHIIYNGKQYLQVTHIKGGFDYPDSVVIEDCLKTAIKLSYKNVVPVMLGGDIYQCICLMKGKRFQEEKRFGEAFDMIKETVAEVMSSWVEQSCKQDLLREVKDLLKEGIEIDINTIGKKDLIAELESRGIELSKNDKKSKERLVEKLGGEKVRLRLGKTVVGGLISALFFNHQDELMEKPFEIKVSLRNKSYKEKEINELSKNIDSKSFVKGRVLEKIKLLNSSSHAFNSWFFREVLSAIVNDEERFNKLKAVCAAICKEPMERLLKDVEVGEDVVDALGFFGVEISSSQVTTSEIPKSSASIGDHFAEDIQKLAEKIKEEGKIEIDKETRGLKESDRLAFSGLSRDIITELKKKRRLKEGLTDDEKDNLSNAVSQAMSEIKEGINILTSSTDVGDIFEHFEVINSEIEKENKREIVELVCQKGNVKLLEIICQQENKDVKVSIWIGYQYVWKGDFTGYKTLIDLLQYVLEQPCSPEIVLCIAEKVYGRAHVIYNGEQYLNSKQIANIKGSFDYSDSVIKNCLKAAIKLSYKNVVQVMLGGDIYHCIRLTKGEEFQEEKKALDMVKKAVAEVMSSWVEQSCKQDLLKEVKDLLKEGIEIDINKMRKQELIDELESRGIELSRDDKRSKERLVEKLGGEKVRLRLGKTVVGGLISALFFNHQDELMEKPFKIKILPQNASKREKEIKELNEKINSKNFVKEKVLEKIKLLNSSSHAFNSCFFREVLAAIVNDEGRFNKLKAVCAAICKEPMERLLKGVEVSEDVVEILRFFGVDPLVLEKSMTSAPENSNVVPSRNIPSLQIEDLTLSSNSRSEKGTSDELRQPSADAELTSDDCSSTSHDPLKINITGPERVAKAKVLSPAPPPPGSKAAEEKNKGFMQTSCGQGENSSYNKGENSHRHGGKVRLTNRGAGMLSQINLEALDKKKKKKLDEASYVSGSLGRVSGQKKIHPPSIQELLDADRLMYMEKTLDKVILNYNTLSYDRLCGSSSSDHDLDESVEEEVVHELFESDDNFVKYQDAVNELVKGNVVTAKRVLLELVNDNVEPAYYAYVLMFFKEVIRQCDVLNTPGENVKIMEKSKDDINTAVQLLKRASFMEPASSFLLGMMKRYNIGECSKLMDGSWRDDLIHVVNVARERRFLNIEGYILKNIDCNNKWDYEKCGLGMQKKDEYIKEMCKYSLYEITLSMLSKQDFNADALNNLFQILFQDEFPEALYSYGAALLKNKVGKGRAFKENVKEAMEYLNRAIVAGHKGAEFLLGILPFTNKVGRRLSNDEVSFCIRKLEDYISKKGGLCAVDKENVDKAAYCLAVEYYTEGSHLVQQHDKQKAGRILRLRGLYKELVNLKDQSQIGLSPSSSVSSVSERCSSAGIEGHSSSGGDDSSLFLSPLSSTKNISKASFSGFPEDYSNIDINKTPATKLSGASAENQSVFGKSK